MLLFARGYFMKGNNDGDVISYNSGVIVVCIVDILLNIAAKNGIDELGVEDGIREGREGELIE